MIIGLRGTIIRKEPTVIHLDVHGVVYEVFVSLQTTSVAREGEIYLHTTHVVREDAQLLYGFSDPHEKVMFDRLIKINGVGPKVAMAICSTFSSAAFFQIVQSSDVGSLKRVPGIGPKSAGRILVELSGFMPETLENGYEDPLKSHQEALMALESLGFKKEAISKVLKKIHSDDTSTIVKEALKLLQ